MEKRYGEKRSGGIRKKNGKEWETTATTAYAFIINYIKL